MTAGVECRRVGDELVQSVSEGLSHPQRQSFLHLRDRLRIRPDADSSERPGVFSLEPENISQ